MAQAEAYKLLKKKRRWLSTGEISNAIHVSRGATSSNLRRLYNQELIDRKIKSVPHMTYFYRVK